MSVYTPAEVVEETGFSLDTLRYYEKIGLLEPISRNAAGQRRFSQEDVGWLGLIRCLRDTGMPIAEMLRFAELVREGDHTFADRARLLEEHDRRVQGQIENLVERRRYIHHKISYYRGAV
ncbi:MerR family transcriptional regulator [Nonomuraea sp. NN258]|uniref:MerR family transcriptional regulator n=1 Tax=Nonomuraea antri TaxID=2730852 RepID=UPI00156942BF|nr:MerR family transcriptional regulator [Nonomuraea antri]NRQ33281.1 MerR family transcriptional regulator [Nonomuraea antri]